MDITIRKYERISLTDDQIEQITLRYLDRVAQGRWVRNGVLWEERHGHHFPAEPVEPDVFALVEATTVLRDYLKNRP